MSKPIFTIPKKAGLTKVQQLVHAISAAIASGHLKEGDSLPSVNQLHKNMGLSRDTIFKAYKILKKQNLIESAPTRGYYVTGGSFRIFILLDDFSAFKEQLYQSFRNNLSKAYSVDLLFHHYNREVFTQLVINSLGRYNFYIIMNIDYNGMEPVLKKIDAGKLLILDMGFPSAGEVSYVIQDFNQGVEKSLQKGASHLKKYSEIILVYNENETPHPPVTALAVKRFCDRNDLKFKTVKKVKSREVKPGQCWFTIRDTDLVDVFKICRNNGYKTGREVGILSYNDTPMKEIAGGGISVVTTDFIKMGLMAAEFVKNRQKISVVLPTSLILRDSV